MPAALMPAALMPAATAGADVIDLGSLNPQQRDAVTTTEGPVLVLAGAGSGKTRVITFRIGHLLARGVLPERILALSFTNKAAGEMQSRVEAMLGPSARGVVMSTFHSLGVRFLREEFAAAGLASGFTILDEGDQLDAVRRALVVLGYDLERYDVRSVHARLSDHRGRLTLPDPHRDPLDGVVHNVLPLYRQRLRAMNAVDFDDLIALPVEAMREDPRVADRWASRFRYVMVDEYQDTNGAQLSMVEGLVRDHRNLCVVGDDDQSIYAWRGAVAGNILEFAEQFAGAKTIALTQNYRSTNTILRAANAVIRNNAARHEKSLWSENGEGELLRYRELPDDDEEARWIVEDLLAQRARHGLAWRDFALLYRTNAQSRALEEALRVRAVPYRLIGGTRFYDRKEVRDVLAYLRALANPFDESAYRRVINFPPRGIGDVSIQRVADHAAETGAPFWHVVRDPSAVEGLSARVRERLKQFDALMGGLRVRCEREPLGDVCRDLIRQVGFADELVRTYPTDMRQVRKRLDDVEEVASALARFDARHPDAGLGDYLARVCLDTRPEEDGDVDADAVRMLTLHAAKGLEFTSVYLAGCEEGLVPHQRTIDGDGDLSEERRLMYVGITRARRWLVLTGARRRLKFGRILRRTPSRFLAEVPPELFTDRGAESAASLSPEEQSRRALAAFDEMLALTGAGDE